MWLNTPALGWLSFYLLDGGAEMTPLLLLGARDMRKRRAMISYHRGQSGAWYASELLPSPGGHLTLSLATPRMPMQYLLDHLDGPPYGSGGGGGNGGPSGAGGDDHPQSSG